MKLNVSYPSKYLYIWYGEDFHATIQGTYYLFDIMKGGSEIHLRPTEKIDGDGAATSVLHNETNRYQLVFRRKQWAKLGGLPNFAKTEMDFVWADDGAIVITVPPRDQLKPAPHRKKGKKAPSKGRIVPDFTPKAMKKESEPATKNDLAKLLVRETPVGRNSGTHLLYVLWAIENLNHTNEVIDRYNEGTSFHAAEAAGALYEVRAKWLEDAAYQDAAILILRGKDQEFVRLYHETEMASGRKVELEVDG